MIIITNQITKADLLREMSESLNNSENSLHLEVESLPNFLNTVVAFTIFNYQISSFPKPVFWLSYDNAIVKFLHNCQAKFPPNFLEAQQPLLTTSKPEFSSEYLHLVSSEYENFDNQLGFYDNTFDPDQSENVGENNGENQQNDENENTNPDIVEEEKLKAAKNYKLVENSTEIQAQKVSDFNETKHKSYIDFGQKKDTQNYPQNYPQTNEQNYPQSNDLQSQNIQNPNFPSRFESNARNKFQKKFQNNLQDELDKELLQQQQILKNNKKIDFNFPISNQLQKISDLDSISAKNLFRDKSYNQSSLIDNDKSSELPKNFSRKTVKKSKYKNPNFKLNFNFWQFKSNLFDKKADFDLNSDDNLQRINLQNDQFQKIKSEENFGNSQPQSQTQNHSSNQTQTNNPQKTGQNFGNKFNYSSNSGSNSINNSGNNSQFNSQNNSQNPQIQNFNNAKKTNKNFGDFTSFPNSKLENPKLSEEQIQNGKIGQFNPVQSTNYFDQKMVNPNLNQIPNGNGNQNGNQNFEQSGETRQNVKTGKKRGFIQGNIQNNSKNKVRFQENVFANFGKTSVFGNLWQNFALKKNSFIAGIVSFSFAVLIFVFFLSFFPTQVYTLEISPIKSKRETDLELNLQQFELQNVNIETENKVATTGKETVSLPKATGKFQLVNRGNSPVYLTNGGFFGTIGDKKYFHNFDSKLPATITINAGNENSRMEMDLEAENKGDNYNLTKTSNLKITNLKGEGVCDNCFARNNGEIKNTKVGVNLATEEDKKKLSELMETEMNKKIQEKIGTDTELTLTNKNWYKIIDKNHKFNAESGKPADELKANSTFNVNIWTLRKEQLIKLIREKDDKIFTVNNLLITNSTDQIDQKSIKITISYNYSQYENLTKDEIMQELSQKPMEEVEKQLQIKYQGLKNIHKEETGFKIPGIRPKINIDINKNSQE